MAEVIGRRAAEGPPARGWSGGAVWKEDKVKGCSKIKNISSELDLIYDLI